MNETMDKNVMSFVSDLLCITQQRDKPILASHEIFIETSQSSTYLSYLY